MAKKICLSFDTEEFDIPLESGVFVSEDVQMKVTKEGLLRVIRILDKENVRATFFVTANFANKNRDLICEISKNHEIASHGYYHSKFSDHDLEHSKKILESIIGKKVFGFRSPRLKKVSAEKLLEAGYSYDSSINPTFIPGRYNNFRARKIPWAEAVGGRKIIRVPTSVSTIFRIPLFWLSFKNLPDSIFKLLTKNTLRKTGYLNVYFHPWEFADISKYKLPKYQKRPSGKQLGKKLLGYIQWLTGLGEFVTLSELIKDYS